MAFGVATVFTNKGKDITTNLVSGLGGTVPKFVAMGTGATGAARTAAAADTALSTEVETRTTGTPTRVTTTVTNDTLQVVGTVTATAGRSVDEGGLFDVVTTSSGNMYTSATFNVITLVSGDSIQFTWQLKYS
jgi:hypothetical protein